MDQPYQVGEDVTVLPSHLDVPGVGTLLVNAFVLHAEDPVLVDAGLIADSEAFVDALRSVVDPARIKWVWLTHDDMDHTGALEAVMKLAPDAKLATQALGALRMATWWPIPLDRVHALVPGDELDAGDRALLAVRPPTYDNPMSTGIFDATTKTLFSVDSFGAILPGAVQSLDDVPEEALVGGMIGWATFDAPWVQMAGADRFAGSLDAVRRLDPDRVLSSHLPPAIGRVDQLLKIVSQVPDAEAFVPPNAEAFSQIVAAMAAGA